MVRFAVCVAVFAAVMSSFPASAGDLHHRKLVLAGSGQATELTGLHTRVIAFSEPAGSHVKVTMLISGGAFGNDIVRTHVKLVDGQRHQIRMARPGNVFEVFSIRRDGPEVSLAFDLEQDWKGDTLVGEIDRSPVRTPVVGDATGTTAAE